METSPIQNVGLSSMYNVQCIWPLSREGSLSCHIEEFFSHRTPKETGNGNSKNSQNIWNFSQKYCTYWVKWEIILNKLRTRTISCRFWCESALATHMHPTRAKPVLGPKCIIPYGTIQLVPKTSLALVMQTSPLGCRYRCSTDCCIIYLPYFTSGAFLRYCRLYMDRCIRHFDSIQVSLDVINLLEYVKLCC